MQIEELITELPALQETITSSIDRFMQIHTAWTFLAALRHIRTGQEWEVAWSAAVHTSSNEVPPVGLSTDVRPYLSVPVPSRNPHFIASPSAQPPVLTDDHNLFDIPPIELQDSSPRPSQTPGPSHTPPDPSLSSKTTETSAKRKNTGRRGKPKKSATADPEVQEIEASQDPSQVTPVKPKKPKAKHATDTLMLEGENVLVLSWFHLKENPKGYYHCALCRLTEDDHKPGGVNGCNQNKELLRAHVRIAHNKGPYPRCYDCQTNFKTRDTLVKHLNEFKHRVDTSRSAYKSPDDPAPPEES